MIQVYKVTLEQANQLKGQTYDGEQYYNPIQDNDGNWFITIEEYNYTTQERINEMNISDWWYSLELIDYNPKI